MKKPRRYTQLTWQPFRHEILYVGCDATIARSHKRAHPKATITKARVTGSLRRDNLFHYTVILTH